MAVIEGMRHTGNVAPHQRVVDLFPQIMLLEPSATPITVILRSIYGQGRRTAAQDKLFSWSEDRLEARMSAATTGANDSATTVEVTDGTQFAEEDVVNVPSTGENLLVTKVEGNNLTVTRGFHGSTAAVIAPDEPLYILGTAATQGTTSQPARSENPVKVDNWTQIFKTTVDASGTWRSSANKTQPHDWVHQLKKAGLEHERDKELAFIFGSPGESPGTDGKPRRSTGGVLHYATENHVSQGGGTLTYSEFETFMRLLFEHGSQTKTLFVSPLVLSVLNEFSRAQLQTAVGSTTYGVKVMEMQSAHGTVQLVKHRELKGDTYGGYGIGIDFIAGNVQYKYLDGAGAPGGSRDTKAYTDRQAPDSDGRKDEIITEAGLQFGLPEVHGVLKGVTG